MPSGMIKIAKLSAQNSNSQIYKDLINSLIDNTKYYQNKNVIQIINEKVSFEP